MLRTSKSKYGHDEIAKQDPNGAGGGVTVRAVPLGRLRRGGRRRGRGEPPGVVLPGLLGPPWGTERREFHLFDTWEGLPAPDVEQDEGFQKGAYLQTIDSVHRNIEAWGVYYNQSNPNDGGEGSQPSPPFVYSWDEAKSRLKIHIGLFADIMPGALMSRSVAALYCDGDMYQSSLDCLAGAGSHRQDGGWIYHDDYFTFTGNYQAVNDWIQTTQTRAHEPLQIVLQSGPWKPFTDLGKCSPPTDNPAQAGTCEGSPAEACFWQVKAL